MLLKAAAVGLPPACQIRTSHGQDDVLDTVPLTVQHGLHHHHVYACIHAHRRYSSVTAPAWTAWHDLQQPLSSQRCQCWHHVMHARWMRMMHALPATSPGKPPTPQASRAAMGLTSQCWGGGADNKGSSRGRACWGSATAADKAAAAACAACCCSCMQARHQTNKKPPLSGQRLLDRSVPSVSPAQFKAMHSRGFVMLMLNSLP